MDNKEVLLALQHIDACEPAIDWVMAHGGSSEQLWKDCVRGDWMFWLIRSISTPEKQKSVDYAIWCANRAKQFASNAADAADAAADAAVYASNAANVASNAADAADAAVYASNAANVAAYAANVASNAADAAVYAADAAAYYEEREEQANYIREHFSCPL